MKWLERARIWINHRGTLLECSGRILALVILSFSIPLLQWLAGKLVEPSGYGTLVGNILAILLFGYWGVRNGLFTFSPAFPGGRAILSLLGVGVLVLLLLDLQSSPTSAITGRARFPFEMVDVVVLGSLAEELVFRGTMWSSFKQLFVSGADNLTALLGTSILFGVGHLGYWAQSNWPLPPFAYLHSISMILAGVCFGVFRLKTGSLATPVLVHMLANGMILLFQ